MNTAIARPRLPPVIRATSRKYPFISRYGMACSLTVALFTTTLPTLVSGIWRLDQPVLVAVISETAGELATFVKINSSMSRNNRQKDSRRTREECPTGC